MSKKESLSKLKKAPFIMIILSFFFGTVFTGIFLWFVGSQLYSSANATTISEQDYLKIYTLDLLSKKIREFNKEKETYPEGLEELILYYQQDFSEIVIDVGDLVYEYNDTDFEVNVILSEDASWIMEKDGGNNDSVYELGTNLNLIP